MNFCWGAPVFVRYCLRDEQTILGRKEQKFFEVVENVSSVSGPLDLGSEDESLQFPVSSVVCELVFSPADVHQPLTMASAGRRTGRRVASFWSKLHEPVLDNTGPVALFCEVARLCEGGVKCGLKCFSVQHLLPLAVADFSKN